MQHFTVGNPLIHMNNCLNQMMIRRLLKSFCIAAVLLFYSTAVQAQVYSFTETQNLTIVDKNDEVLDFGVCGGFNQAQFLAFDVDNDGTMDVVVYDRTGSKVLPFINVGGKLVYKPEYEQAFPKFESWVSSSDFNADGKNDLWFDKNGYIALYKNATKPSEKMVRFEVVTDELRGYNFNTDTNAIDTSSLYSMKFNQPAFQDVDFDGDIDILTLQPFGYGITLFLNATAEKGKPLDPPDFEIVDYCWADFEEAPNNDSIYLERNKFCFASYYRYKKKHSGGSSLLLIDKDDDKDMDLILGNAGFNNIIMLENGKTDFGLKCDSMIAYDLNYPLSKPARVDLYPASFHLDVDNDGLKDLIVAASLADYSSGYTKETEQIWFYKNEGTNAIPDFRHKMDDFLVGQSLDYGGYAVPELYDLDDDGDLDLLLGTNGGYFETHDSSDRIVFLRNIGNKNKPIFKEAYIDFLEFSLKGYQNITLSIGNLDDDGVLDLLIGKVDGTLDWYNIVKVGSVFQLKEVELNAFNINVNEAAAPTITDVDKDGLSDLLVGCFAGNTYYYRNTGTKTSPTMTLLNDTFGNALANGFLLSSGSQGQDSFVQDWRGYSSPKLIDINGDGMREFVTGSQDGKIKVWDGVEGHFMDSFTEVRNLYYDPLNNECKTQDFGSRSYAAIADLNNDGRMDMVVGNSRGGIHYLEGIDTNCLVSTPNLKTIERHIKVYPNPTQNLITVELAPEIEAYRFDIYDVKGNLIMSTDGSQNQIDLLELPMGIYTLSVRTNYGTIHKKIVKYN